jgi:hypothetical protein
MLARGTFADMAQAESFDTVGPPSSNVSGRRLRENSQDFPSLHDRRIRLLQLHGSLSYWASPDKTVHVKLATAQLANKDLWAALREDPWSPTPAVLLTNQREKNLKVKEFPFCLAYDMFQINLNDASHWLIAGYSFKDQVANDMLKKAFNTRAVKPHILVITKGDELTDEKIKSTIGNQEMAAASYQVLRSGVQDMEKSNEWQSFSDSVKIYEPADW